MRTFSAELIKLAAKDLKIERLDVSNALAMEMFKDNRYKTEQLPSISAQNNGQVTVYRVGQHVDISRGPMIGSTGQLGRCTISAVHEIGHEGDGNGIYRVQGVALPIGIRIGHFAYGILEERSSKLVRNIRIGGGGTEADLVPLFCFYRILHDGPPSHSRSTQRSMQLHNANQFHPERVIYKTQCCYLLE